jgi:hypothetical protein
MLDKNPCKRLSVKQLKILIIEPDFKEIIVDSKTKSFTSTVGRSIVNLRNMLFK